MRITLCWAHVNIRFKLILLLPLEIFLMIISYFISDFKDLERLRSTGGDLENTLRWYSAYHEDELE